MTEKKYTQEELDAHTAAVTAKAVAEKQAETDQLRFDLREATESLVARMAQASAPAVTMPDLLELAECFRAAFDTPIARRKWDGGEAGEFCRQYFRDILGSTSKPAAPQQHAQAALSDDDLPPLTMSVYGTRTALELERQRRADVAARSAPAQPIAGELPPTEQSNFDKALKQFGENVKAMKADAEAERRYHRGFQQGRAAALADAEQAIRLKFSGNGGPPDDPHPDAVIHNGAVHDCLLAVRALNKTEV